VEDVSKVKEIPKGSESAEQREDILHTECSYGVDGELNFPSPQGGLDLGNGGTSIISHILYHVCGSASKSVELEMLNFNVSRSVRQ